MTIATMYEIHVLIGRDENYKRIWRAKMDHKGEPIQFWERSDAVKILNHMEASINSLPAIIVPVEVEHGPGGQRHVVNRAESSSNLEGRSV